MPIIQFKGKTAVESYHRVVPHHTLEIDAKLSPAKKPGLDGNLMETTGLQVVVYGHAKTSIGRWRQETAKDFWRFGQC